jgi:hypothetical protein
VQIDPMLRTFDASTTVSCKVVPIIAVFFGIVIRMFYKEHEPAHFHAEYQGQNTTFDFDGQMAPGASDRSGRCGGSVSGRYGIEPSSKPTGPI